MIISRVAESCFWMNRYVERVEVLARMLGVNLGFQLDVGLDEADGWKALVEVTGQGDAYRARVADAKANDAETVQDYLTWDDENPISLRASLRAARDNARTVRETISLEMWETLNDLWVWLESREAARLYRGERAEFYLRLRNQCLLFHGIAQATMLHEDPFEFMRLGTALERTGQTARLLDVKYHSLGPTRPDEEMPDEIAQWLAVLRFCSGVEPFLKRRTATPSGAAVADFLLFEPAFARSVVHNLDRLGNFLGLVAPPDTPAPGLSSQVLLEETRQWLASTTIDAILARGLHDTLTTIVGATAKLSDAISRDFFDSRIPGGPGPAGEPSV
jgi:uncharacterized alpha-E superfamily protein